jgi:hypothetical protein
MLLDRGRVVDIGAPASIARQYNDLNFRRVRREAIEHGSPEVFRRPPVAELLSAAFESPAGDKLVAMAQGDPCWVRMEVRFHADEDDPLFSISLRNELGHTAFSAGTWLQHGPTGHFRSGERAIVRVRFDNWLAPGRYSLTASVNKNGPGGDSFDTREDISSIIVHASRSGGGITDLPHSFQIERA